MKKFYIKTICLGFLLLFSLTACEPTSQPDSVPTFSYQFTIRDDSDGDLLKGAGVRLAIGGTTTKTVFTVDDGTALFELDRSFIDRTAQVDVTLEGYESYTSFVNLQEGVLPSEIRLTKRGIVVITATPSDTPTVNSETTVPVTSATATSTSVVTTVETNTPQVPLKTPTPSVALATDTAQPPPTSTVESPTPTPSPSNVSLPQLQIVSSNTFLYIYANEEPGQALMNDIANGEIVNLLATTEDYSWFYIEIPERAVGWIPAVKARAYNEFVWGEIFVSDDLYGGFIESNNPSTSGSEGSSGSSSGSSLSCGLAVQTARDETTAELIINWRGVTSAAHHLLLNIRGNDGREVFTNPIYGGEFIDRSNNSTEGSYRMPFTKLQEMGYLERSSFTLTLRTQTADNRDLCIKSTVFDIP